MALREAIYIAIVFAFLAISSVHGHATGAPDSSCVSMTPSHGGAGSKNNPLLYEFSVSDVDVILNEQEMFVTLYVEGAKESPSYFKGFFLQARKVGGDSTPQGTWVPDKDISKGVSCGGQENSALTHINPDEKTDLVAQWKPPGVGQYQIYLTVVEKYSSFWALQKSAVVNVRTRY